MTDTTKLCVRVPRTIVNEPPRLRSEVEKQMGTASYSG